MHSLQGSIRKPQTDFNFAAWLLSNTKRREHISPVTALHWLPVIYRTDFKVLLLTYKALNGEGPSYISNTLFNYTPTRRLHSSTAGFLEAPRKRSPKKIGEAAFINYAPKLLEHTSQKHQSQQLCFKPTA